MSDRIEKLEEMVKVQCSDGNWDYDPYMHGMANGMIFCLAIMRNVDPEYLDPPKTWLVDKPYPKTIDEESKRPSLE